MHPRPNSPPPDRREFLHTTAATLAAGSLAGFGEGGTSGDASRSGPPIDTLPPPEWVRGVTRMAFLSPGEVAKAAKLGVQVVHTNVVWPYFPLRRDGGGAKLDW